VRFEKDLRRLRNAARSQGAYLGVSTAKIPDAGEADFFCVMADRMLVGLVDFDRVFRVEFAERMRRFFACESASPREFRSTLEASSFDVKEVVDLLPIPLRRAWNFRFVAFMAE
jgi:hypothetical protein